MQLKDLASHESLDLKNSIFWFFMDAFWLFGFNTLAYICFFPTLLTAISSAFLAQTRSGFLIGCMNACWVIVNGGWLIAETKGIPDAMIIAKSFFVLGGLFLLASLILEEKEYKTSFIKNIFRINA